MENRAVSEVVGVMLMIVLTIALAASVTTLAMGFSDYLAEPQPAVSFSDSYDGETLTIDATHSSNVNWDNVNIVDSDGNSVVWTDIAEPRGEVEIDGQGDDSELNKPEPGDEYTVTYESGEHSYILREFEV